MKEIISKFKEFSLGQQISICCALLLIFALLIIIVAKIIKRHKINKEIKSREVDDVNIKNGIRYTDDMTIFDDIGNTNISYGKEDCVLKINTTYIADRKGYVKPGKYTILSTKESEEKFNIRIGDYVKEYHHGQKVILAEGEEITPVSNDIILR